MSGAPQIVMLRQRAELLARAREFFAARGVLEVDTPLLGEGLVVESHIDPIPCQVTVGAGEPERRHLLTSPEGPMKRLLALGSGPIYQFAHAFRDGEVGRRHSVEFTMLEWYRPDYDHHALMDEVEALVGSLLPTAAGAAFERRTYREVFLEHAGVDPFTTSLAELADTCKRLGVSTPPGFQSATVDDALDLLLVAHIEPSLGKPKPLFVYDYPASQAALAKTRDGANGHRVAERFELYVAGVELANGYHELADPAEQRRRFAQANQTRAANSRPTLPIDEALIEALGAGFPACAGVALGFDRLVMLATGADSIREARAEPAD